MEDGGESRVIKNMKMNKFRDAVLGSSQQLQSFSLHLTWTLFKARIKEKNNLKKSFYHYTIFLLHFLVDYYYMKNMKKCLISFFLLDLPK